MWNLLHLSKKWSDCHEKNNKHVNWTLDLKCEHQVWPWPWIFKVKCLICYILSQNDLIASKWKNECIVWKLGLKCSLYLRNGMTDWCEKKEVNWLVAEPTMWPWSLTTLMALTMDFQGQIDIAISQEWVDRLTLNKRHVSRSFMIMIVTFWWPRWSVRIYQIVTGGNSDVHVASTHLLLL